MPLAQMSQSLQICILLVTYRCCGAETTFDLGYMAWEDNDVLQPRKAVPDSCCLHPTEGCGKDIFKGHSLKKMAEYVKKIHVHGCLHAMDQVLKVTALNTFFIMPCIIIL